jgi:hypothetical protein
VGQAIYSNASLMAQKQNKLKNFDKSLPQTGFYQKDL